MNTKVTIMACLSATILVAGIMAGFNMLSAKTALARSDTSTTANHFGKGASELGKSGEMGKHSASTQGGGDRTEPRLGIGNVGQALCNEKLKPGQLADRLNTGQCP